ncbi:MAG: metallophosphoesterase family protein [Clostridiales bacterium]|nr:metallophosphoesterase family protein [Clostridiales bacterium]
MIKEKPVRGSSVRPDHIMISFSDDDVRTSMNIAWRTSTDVIEGYVEYHKKGGKPERVKARTKVFESDIDISNMFWAKLTGLESGTEYFYTCGGKDVRSEEYSFRTAPENIEKFKFICVSDQQRNDPFECPDYSGFNKFIKSVLKDNPDTAFILTGGDNTDCGQHEVQWNGALCGLEGIAESVPFMMALGNHDNRGFKDYKNYSGRYYSEPAEFFGKQFEGLYPDNGPENWKTENYFFDYGNSRFTVIGINGPEEVNDWLIKTLDGCDKTWKFGAYHFPICYSGVNLQNYDAYPVMREGFEKLDIVFSGHEHNFSRSFPLRNEELHERPSQGTIHYMLGNSNCNPPGARTLAKVWHAAFFAHEEKKAMVAIVEVEGSKVTMTSVLDDGRIVDKCVIDKETDSILPYALPPVFSRTRVMFKGADPGLCHGTTPCEKKDGVWFIPIASFIAFMGGYVEKTEGRAYMEVYGRSLEIIENSDNATANGAEMKLPAPVFRGRMEQLYAPVDAVKAFDMRWAYSEYNNFISVEHESESIPVTKQP